MIFKAELEFQKIKVKKNGNLEFSVIHVKSNGHGQALAGEMVEEA